VTTVNEALQSELEEQRRLFGAFGQLDRVLRKHAGYDLHVPMESSVTGLMVLPMLRALGWRSVAAEGHVETYCEYKSRVFQVDVAVLASDGLPRVLIEVKRPGEDPAFTDERAKRQLWGYAFEACRLHSPLAAVVLTNGHRWRVWRVSRETASIVPQSIDIDVNVPDQWPRFEALERAQVTSELAPTAGADPSWPTAPEGAWLDREWNPEKERFPKVYEHPTTKRLVVATGWNPGVQKRYRTHHGGDAADATPRHCDGCGRAERLGHTCDGSLPPNWRYRVP